jgi:hypothetical protein
MEDDMRGILVALAIVSPALTADAAERASELLTADNAILCVQPANLEIANQPTVAESQTVLRGMGCLRTESGIRAQLLGNALDRPWQVRFFPVGISNGIVLWGLPSSFTNPDRSKPTVMKRASS